MDRVLNFSDVASMLGRPFEGPDLPVRGINDPLSSKHDDLVVIMDRRWLKSRDKIRSRVWVVGTDVFSPDLQMYVENHGMAYLVSDRPQLDFVTLIRYFHPAPPPLGIHPGALISPSARLGAGVSVGAMTVIGDSCSIGERTIVHAHVTIDRDVVIGSDSLIYSNVVIESGVHVGSRVTIHSGTVIGTDGFGYFTDNGRHQKIPHVGRVAIEDDVEIGANCCIARGTLGWTRIGRGTKIDNLVQVAHNVRIGEDGLIAAQSGIAGSTEIGNRVTIAGQVGIVGHIRVGDHVTIGAQAGVIGTVEDGQTVSGYPARPHAQAMRREAEIGRISEILARLRKLEEQ